MPVKLKEFLQKTFEQGDVRGDDVAALLGASSLAELEMPDAAVLKFNESYLTRARAENDPDIVKKIKLSSKAEILDTVDAELVKLFPLIDAAKAAEIGKDKNTFKKLELIAEALKDTVQNSKQSKDKDVQKVESEWAEKTKLLESSYKNQLSDLVKQNEDSNKKFVLKSKLLTFDYADAFKELKEPLIDTIINKIDQSKTKEGNQIILELDQTGTLNVRQSVEGTLRDIFVDGNDKLTIDKLIAPHVEPFIRKSNGTGSGANQQGNGKNKGSGPVDTSKMTLAELRFHEAQ